MWSILLKLLKTTVLRPPRHRARCWVASSPKPTVEYGLSHYPELDREGHWQRTLQHLHEKYAEGGYIKLWLKDSPNTAPLAELRDLIRDEARLRPLFDQYYSLNTKH